MTDHGHTLLMKHILQLKHLNKIDIKGKSIIEIGSVREELEGQNSTEAFIKFCIENEMKLISVDMDSNCIDNAKKLCDKHNFKAELIVSKGEDYLETIKSFDFIYLDGYDYNHGKHSKERNDRYLENMDKEINDTDCWKSNLIQCKNIVSKGLEHSLICIDDVITDNRGSNKVGKGVTALPFLIENKWNVLEQNPQSVILTKSKVTGGKNDIYVVGNGKSLKDFDFEFLKDKEWIGCTMGFRHWEKLGFYPKHYVNVDKVVIKSNLEDIKKLITEKKCESYLLDCCIYELFPESQYIENVLTIQELKYANESPFRYMIDYCSGSAACLYSYILCASHLHLLGFDCNYIEILPECEELENGTLKIIKPIEDNPNYYCDLFQQVGDIYNKPNTARVHKPSWTDFRNTIILYNILRQTHVFVYNYSNSGELDNLFEQKKLSCLANENEPEVEK